MKFKRNLKLYIKEKSTLWGLASLIVFLILAIVTYAPFVKNKKGIYDEFNDYPITFLKTNNYNVTYAASNNILFYSQNKYHQSTLNDLCGIKDYSNEYGTYETKLYNFIKINYSFPSNIKDVEGISDNALGENGETFILCEDGSVYLISKHDPNIEKVFFNVKKFHVKHDYLENQNYYLVYDNTDHLYLYYFENNELNKLQIFNQKIDDFYFLTAKEKTYEILVQIENKISLVVIDESNVEYKKADIKSTFIVNENQNSPNLVKQEQLFLANQIVQNEDKIFALIDGIVYQIDGFLKKEIKCSEKINYIYCCGEDACIGVSDTSLFYTGKLYHKDYINEESFEYFGKAENLVYGNRNSIIVFKNKSLFLYNDIEKKFEAMYTNILVTIMLRPLFFFISFMSLFYILLSFYEASKRYNRYFSKVQKEQK